MDKKPILYIKQGCPWCSEAVSHFARQEMNLIIKDVSQNTHDMDHMIKITGQSLTPTFEYGDFIVADFSIDEFQQQLENAPDVKKALGIK